MSQSGNPGDGGDRARTLVTSFPGNNDLWTRLPADYTARECKSRIRRNRSYVVTKQTRTVYQSDADVNTGCDLSGCVCSLESDCDLLVCLHKVFVIRDYCVCFVSVCLLF